MSAKLWFGVVAASLGMIATACAQPAPAQPEPPEVVFCGSYAPRGSDAFYQCLINKAEERGRVGAAAQAQAEAQAQIEAAERARNLAIFGAALQNAGRAFQGPPQYNCTTTYIGNMAQTHCQ